MAGGVSIVIPSANRHRLHLLSATLAGMRRCDAVEQIVIAEMGSAPHALDLARRYGADYVFTSDGGAFNRSRMMNAGAALARGAEILWCDGDFLFEPSFLLRAQREMRDGGADYFFPHSLIDYLDEQNTQEVLAGRRHPRECGSLRRLAPITGNPGGMGMVRADFLQRHGGMIEGFRGWGFEDHGWLHKARLLGKVCVSHAPEQRVWHLFHADSGSHSERALREAARRNAHYAANAQLMERIAAIRSPEAFARHFPAPKHLSRPWAPHARIVFIAAAQDWNAASARRARGWAQGLERFYGLAVPVGRADPRAPDAAVAMPDADAVVGFADDPVACHALMSALGARLTLLVSDAAQPGDIPLTARPVPMILARRPEQRDAWAARATAWHLPWQADTGPADHPPAPLVGALSILLGATRRWKIRIELDRAALPPAALDRPRFWYVGLHDADAVELMRQDLCGAELKFALADPSRPVTIERTANSPLPPATWTVWPTDCHGRWLDKLSGPAAAEDLGLVWNDGGRNPHGVPVDAGARL